MQEFIWQNLSKEERISALERPAGLSDNTVINAAANIMKDVQSRGDAALRNYTQRFDKVKLNNFKISISELEAAWKNLPKDDKSALKTAKANIEKFHVAQMPKPITVETQKGVICRREARPIESAALYVPGGTAPLVSTVLMLAVPSKVAGVKHRIILTPPSADGTINQAILAAAYLCGVRDVYAVGGAQAIAAATYGTETIPKSDKIFGPGNAYVAAAKVLASQVAGGPAIDLPAGPSEAMVVADENANPVFVAADLLSQAEHDSMAQVICIATSEAVAKKIKTEIDAQVKTLPRQAIANDALSSSRMFISQNRNDIFDIINAYAPEHLILQIDDANDLVPGIQHAGSIFLGPWTPESVGDYASGTNHTLPTYGAARAYSGVTLESFLKYISIQELSEQGLRNLGPTVERLASLEELEAHRRAISLRLESLSS